MCAITSGSDKRALELKTEYREKRKEPVPLNGMLSVVRVSWVHMTYLHSRNQEGLYHTLTSGNWICVLRGD